MGKIYIHVSPKLLQVTLPKSLAIYKKKGKRIKRFITYIYQIDSHSNPIQLFLNDMDTRQFVSNNFYQMISKYEVEIIFGSNKKSGKKLLLDLLDFTPFNNITLIFHRRINGSIDLTHDQKINTVIFRGKHNGLFNKMPKNMQVLYLAKNHILESKLPNVHTMVLNSQVNLYGTRIENVCFTYPYNKPVDGLNEFVSKLSIESREFNFPLSNLPTGLKRLIITSYVFNHELSFLPESLEYLELNIPSYKKNLSDLPTGLKELVVKRINSSTYTNIIIPIGLEVLRINQTYLSVIKYVPKEVQVYTI